MKAKIILLICFLQGISAFSQNSKSVYVDGRNTENGTGDLANPFKSIQLAVSSATAGDSIVVREGIYREQVSLTKGNLTFVPFANEKVIVSGADPLLSWQPVKNSIYKTVMKWNVTQSDQSNQVFCDRQMMDLVRWPTNAATTLLPSNAFADKVTDDGTNYVISDADFQEPAGKWDGCEIWVNFSRTINVTDGWDGQGWTGRIISASPGKIIVQGKMSGRISNEPWGLGPNTEYFLFNPTTSAVTLSGGIDKYLKAGQWWKKGDTLFVNTFNGNLPSSTVDGTNLVEAKKRLYSFTFSGQSKITIKGLNTFASAINTDESGFFNRTSSVCNSANILIDGIKAEYVTHFTNQAKNMQMQWNQRSGFILSGTNITLQNSEIHYSAGSGVSVFGRGNKILNNKIWDVNYSSSECGAMNTGLQYDPGLVISEDHEIAYNTIYNTPQQGINIRAMVNSTTTKPGVARIHHNIIHDFMIKTHDSGAIDTYNTDGKWMRVDHNMIYNAPNVMHFGFYLDFGTNYIVDHNLFYNMDSPILINDGGWDPNPTQICNVWVFNNTALANKLGKSSITNGAGPFTAGFNVFNNITTSTLTEKLTGPFVFNNFNPKISADMVSFFTNALNQDYTLNLTKSPCIDTCELAPFNDQIINKPDAGCFESGVPAWKAGYGNLKKQFLISDNIFSLKTGYKVQKDWTFPVYVLPFCGFTGDVNLSVTDLPKGIKVSLSANTVTAGQSVDFTISVSDSTSPGINVIKLVGASGDLIDTRYYTIEVQQEVGSIKIMAPIGGVKYKTQYQFKAVAYDQIGNLMRIQPVLSWTCKNGGTISSTGLYTAVIRSPAISVFARFGTVKDSCVFIVSDKVSADDLNSIKQILMIRPNPASEKATVDYTSELSQDVQLSVYSNSGSRVRQIHLKAVTGKNRFELTTSDLKSGIYLIELKGKKWNETAKLVVQN
jgi:Secretion system C-terminal sorting domain